DCPPPPGNDIGGLPIAFDLTTGTKTVTAAPLSGQANVFCGFCRDISAAATGCFEGDPNNFPTTGCPRNNLCTAAANPFNCCTGSGTGPCAHPPPPCTSAAQGTEGKGPWPDCQQRTSGAFGPAGGGARTINEPGAPAGNMTDGAGHASVLASIFC